MSQVNVVQVPVLNGMREDMSEHVSQPGTLRNAENVRFPISGEVQARRGTTALAVATTADVAYTDALTSGPDFLARCPGGFLFGAAGFGFRYDLAQGRVHAAGSYANAVPEGRVAVISRESTEITVGESVPLSMSVAVGGGYVAVCWASGSGAVSGSRAVVTQVYTESGTLVETIVDDTYIMGVVLYDSVSASFILLIQTNTDIVAKRLSVAASGVVVAATATPGVLSSSSSTWTAVSWPGIGWALAYRTAFNEITVKQLSSLTTLNTVVIADGRSTAAPLSLYCDTTHLYLGWTEDNVSDCDALARVYDTTLTLTSGGTVTLATVIGAGTTACQAPLFGASATAGTVFGVLANASQSNVPDLGSTSVRPFTLTSAGVAAVGSTPVRNMWPVSGPFANGMVWCMYRLPFEFDYANNYWRLVLLDYANDRMTASGSLVKLNMPTLALCGDAFADPAGGAYMGGRTKFQQYSPQLTSSGYWYHAQPRLVRSEYNAATGKHYGLVIADAIKFRIGTARQSCALGAETLVAGSPVLLTDTGLRGTTTGAVTDLANQRYGIDLGMGVEPAVDVPTQSNTANGSLTLLGVYQYRTVLEWVDGTGRRWRSRASRVQSVTMTGANDTLTFTSDDDYQWLRQSGLTCSQIVKHYYRTTNGGSTFYRATPPQGAPIAWVATAFVDEVSDARLAQREILYTDGSVLDNDHAPSCKYIRTTEDRVWCAGLWDLKQLQSSKIIVPGEPPQFSDSPAFRVALADDCTGIAAQDGVVIAFAASAIYVIQGQGPSDQGQGAWDNPRCITRSSGCTNALSLLETSAGVFFQSSRGIELLPRGLGEPQFIGAPVQDSLGSLTVTSAAVISSNESRTARFCTGTTLVLVYDLDTGAWSRDVYPMAIKAICDTDSGAVLATTTVSNGYGFLLESATATVDSTGNSPTAITSTLEWCSVRPFGIAGHADYSGAIGLFDSLTADSAPGYQSGNATIQMQVDAAVDAGLVFNMSGLAAPGYRKHAPLAHMGTACQLTLTTAAIGWRFMGWTLELENQGGGRRMAETEQG